MAQLRFDGRVAIVTGAGRGIGRAHALLLAARGAKVVVNDLGGDVGGGGASTAPAQGVVDEIAGGGGEAVAEDSSVATVEGAQALVATALERYGRLDIVVNNAGILSTGEFTDTEPAELSRHLSVHLHGTFNVCRAAWPHLAAQGYGRVVATTSASWLGMRTIVAYASAKAGLVGLVRSLAAIGADTGIKANLIAPLANTRMTGRSRLAGGARTDEGASGGNGAEARGDAGAPSGLGANAPAAPASRRDPELIAPVMAFLAHESCPVNGELFSAGMGHVARVFVAETVGYSNTDLAPEDVRDNWDRVMDEAGYFVPGDFAAYSANFKRNHAALLDSEPT